jgi:hypothetical protein
LRTRSARTPSARPIAGPSCPSKVHNTARARSASPRSADRDSPNNASRSAAVATNPERRPMLHHHFNTPCYPIHMWPNLVKPA